MSFNRRALIGLFISGVVLFYLVMVNPLGERALASLDGASQLKQSSENIRMVFPYITMKDVLTGSPVWGVGISGKEVVESFTSLPFDLSTNFGNNNFAAMFTYLGLVGAVLFCVVQYYYFKRVLPVREIVMFSLFAFGLSQTMGAFESPRYWGYLFLFAGALQKSCILSAPLVPLKKVARREDLS